MTLAKIRRQGIQMKKVQNKKSPSSMNYRHPAVANAAVPASTQNTVTAKAAAPNQQAINHLATQSQASDNSAVPNAPGQSLAEPPAAIPDVSADNASTVAAVPTVQPVAPLRGGAQRYDLRPRPKPFT